MALHITGIILGFLMVSLFYKYKAFVFKRHLNNFSHLILKDKTRIFYTEGNNIFSCCPSTDTELESVKALFTEKEKELVMAVAKVEEMTRQLEAIRNDRSSAKNGTQNPAALELEKLRKELMVSY